MTDNDNALVPSIDQEIATIETKMAEDSRAYWHDPALQRRYGELLKARETGTVPAVAGARKAEIEKMMAGGTASEYWHSPQLQQEYRAILDAEAGGAPSPGAPRVAPAGGGLAPAAGRAPAEVAKDFGVSEDAATVAMNTAGEIESAFGASAADINAVVSGLPDGLRQSMIAELGNPYVPRQPEADQASVVAFRDTAAGKLLAVRWGGDLPRRLGVALARVERFEAGLDDAAFNQWTHFWRRGLSADQRAQVLDRLTA